MRDELETLLYAAFKCDICQYDFYHATGAPDDWHRTDLGSCDDGWVHGRLSKADVCGRLLALRG